MSKVEQLLNKKAILSYVPRTRFFEMANNRKRTKTPPGFKDSNDGDFFVWIEFLYGLLKAKDSGGKFNHAILLTDDTKKDWSYKNEAHPILAAEVQSLVGVPFDVWTTDQLCAEITQYP